MTTENKTTQTIEPAIAVEHVLGAVHSCLRCKWLYFNEGENKQDCGLGYLGNLVKSDIKWQNGCYDFEHCT